MLVESRILSFGIWNSPQGICNPTNDWNGESKFHWKGIWTLQRGMYNPRLSWITLNTRSYNLYMGQDYKGNNYYLIKFLYNIVGDPFQQLLCSNLCLDHNVFLHLKVGVCPTFCNLCCSVKEGKLLPLELFDVTTKGLCVHTTLI